MNVIPKSFRVRINRAAHDQALRHEMQLRDKWAAQLSDAIKQKATYDQLQSFVSGFEAADETDAR